MDSGAAHSWLVGKEAQEWFADSNIKKIRQAGASNETSWVILLCSVIRSASEISTTKGCPSLHLARTCNEVTFIPSQGQDWQNTWPSHPPPGLIWFAGAWIAFGVTRRVLQPLPHISHRITKWGREIFWHTTHIRVQKLSHSVTCYKKHRKTSICFQSQPKVPIDGVYSTKDARTAQGILYKSQTLNTNSSNDSNHSQVVMPWPPDVEVYVG